MPSRLDIHNLGAGQILRPQDNLLANILKLEQVEKFSQISEGTDPYAVLTNINVIGEREIKIRLFGIMLAVGSIMGVVITTGQQS